MSIFRGSGRLLLAVAGVLAATASPASAGLTSASGATDVFTDETTRFEGNGAATVIGQATYVSASIGPSGVLAKTFNYSPAPHFGQNGFRLVESLVNNTGFNITSLTMTLTGVGAIFESVNGPAIIESITAGSPNVVEYAERYLNGTNSNITVSPDNKSVTFEFDTPIAPGESANVYVALFGNGSGTFDITQSITTVPEPATMALLAPVAFGAFGFGLRRWRRSETAVAV